MAFNARDPRFLKSVIGVLLVGGVLYTYFFTDWFSFTYKANASELNTLEGEYRELSKDLNKARQAINRLPFLEKEYELLHRKWEQGRVLLPEDEAMITLLREVTLLGTRAGVEFTLFEPLELRPMMDYTEVPVQVTVAGGYHQVGGFLAEVANMERIVNVTSLLMETAKDRNQTDDSQTATATFEAVAYRLGGTGVPASPDGEGTTAAGASAGRRGGE